MFYFYKKKKKSLPNEEAFGKCFKENATFQSASRIAATMYDSLSVLLNELNLVHDACDAVLERNNILQQEKNTQRTSSMDRKRLESFCCSLNDLEVSVKKLQLVTKKNEYDVLMNTCLDILQTLIGLGGSLIDTDVFYACCCIREVKQLHDNERYMIHLQNTMSYRNSVSLFATVILDVFCVYLSLRGVSIPLRRRQLCDDFYQDVYDVNSRCVEVYTDIQSIVLQHYGELTESCRPCGSSSHAICQLTCTALTLLEDVFVYVTQVTRDCCSLYHTKTHNTSCNVCVKADISCKQHTGGAFCFAMSIFFLARSLIQALATFVKDNNFEGKNSSLPLMDVTSLYRNCIRTYVRLFMTRTEMVYVMSILGRKRFMEKHLIRLQSLCKKLHDKEDDNNELQRSLSDNFTNEVNSPSFFTSTPLQIAYLMTVFKLDFMVQFDQPLFLDKSTFNLSFNNRYIMNNTSNDADHDAKPVIKGFLLNMKKWVRNISNKTKLCDIPQCNNHPNFLSFIHNKQ